jgi:hypothetical protein
VGKFAGGESGLWSDIAERPPSSRESVASANCLPDKGGLLSGKYTRENVATKKSDRGGFAVTPTEKEFVVLDQHKVVAEELDTNVAAVALAWVRSRPGTSDHWRAPDGPARRQSGSPRCNSFGRSNRVTRRALPSQH